MGPPKGPTDLINQGQDDQMSITGYKRNTVKTVIVWFFIVITAGLLRLFFYWLPHLMVKATHSVCRLADASVVILKDEYDQWFVSDVMVATKDGQVLRDSARTSSVESNGSRTPFAGEPAVRDRSDSIRYFVTKKVKYVWSRESQAFLKLKGIEDGVSCAYFHQAPCLSFSDVFSRRITYGFNSIDIHVTPIIKLLFKEVLSPFYIFQLFSVCLWFSDEYYYYAGCICLISIVSITATIYQTRKMQRALRNTIQSSTIVSVCRGAEEYQQVSSEDLVPGDIIEIPRNGCMMQCDAVLITGNCIVNESMLTGESVPVTKTPLPNPKMTHDDSVVNFNIKDHSRHILFCGTHVIQTRYYGGQKVKAVVFRTGFSTAKGELVRSILHPKPVDFRFNKDTYKFVGILAGIACMGLIFTVVLMSKRGELVGDIITRALDLITIAVPPALPAALTVGIVFAQTRLRRAKIYCISPRSINVCGSINVVCFDKTGTLTEDGLDMHSVIPAQDGKFGHEIQDVKLVPPGNFMVGMATCHSLTIIDGVLSGDPLELIMFDATGWDLTEPGEESSRFDMICPTIVTPKSSKLASSIDPSTKHKITWDEVGIVRQFTFSSSLQRMSVIIRKLGADHFEIFTKGAPEMVASLCVTDTVPDNFHEMLNGYTKHGYRVLALAYKPLPDKLKYPKLQRIQREQVERGLTFLGLIVMENRLKPETTPVIKQLKAAKIRPVMVTGDNMLTALSVARECHFVEASEPIILVQAFPEQLDPSGNIIEPAFVEYIFTESPQERDILIKETQFQNDKPVDIEKAFASRYHFAVTGKSWSVLRQHFDALLEKIVVRGTIFARMSPDQKGQLVETLQDLGFYVGMCGDGANDCGALKTAHAGISLSEAEASVASPFTSKNANISCVPTVIREGRAALVTSFGIFKYMATYSLTQFTSVIILYWVGVNVTDFQFLYIDLFLLTSLSISFGYTEAYGKLHWRPPLVSLLSLSPVCSLIFHMIIMVAFQVFFYLYIQKASWFVPWVDDPEEDYDYTCYENTAVFYSSMYQYIIQAFVFAKGKPYRKPVYTNYYFLINLFICFAVSLWLNIYPTTPVAEFFEIMEIPSIPYKFIFVLAAFINLFICLLLETFILDSHFLSVTLQNKLSNLLPGAKPRYEALEQDMLTDTNWPPVKNEDLAETFQRLDSMIQNSNMTLNTTMDNLSLSGSETESLASYGGNGKATLIGEVGIKLDKSGHVNKAFDSEERNGTVIGVHQYDNMNNGDMSTRL